jgi:hypothetical protein
MERCAISGTKLKLLQSGSGNLRRLEVCSDSHPSTVIIITVDSSKYRGVPKKVSTQRKGA